MNIEKIIYWIATAIMSGVFLFSAGMYFTKYEMVTGFFEMLSFPTWLVYPLATAKILGVIAIVTRQSKLLKEWAYAGFFFNGVLATTAHYDAGHGVMGLSLLALIAVIVSRFFDGRAFVETK